MASLIPETEVAKAIQGRTVAVVGNSGDILHRHQGPEIDSHDVVIRMNPGNAVTTQDYLGTKTSMQTIGRALFMGNAPRDALLWWMKLTISGRKELRSVLNGSKYPHAIWDWPKSYEDEVRKFVGRDGSSGVRVLWALTHRFEPKSIDCYGISCWGRLVPGVGHSTWNDRGPTPSHDPQAEANAILALGFKVKPEGVLTWDL